MLDRRDVLFASISAMAPALAVPAFAQTTSLPQRNICIIFDFRNHFFVTAFVVEYSPMPNTKINQILKTLPTKPGVYLHKNAQGKVIYVGKAVNLRSRVRSYFHKSAQQTEKTRRLVAEVADIEFIVADSELEALLLENTLIKKYQPRFNVRLKDDKRYPYIKVHWQDSFPKVTTTRRLQTDGARYYVAIRVIDLCGLLNVNTAYKPDWDVGGAAPVMPFGANNQAYKTGSTRGLPVTHVDATKLNLDADQLHMVRCGAAIPGRSRYSPPRPSARSPSREGRQPRAECCYRW